MKDVVNKLIKLNKTISTMESCTGGFLASSITNIDDSSKVFKFGSVTYSNEYKIKMGVDSNIIDKYTVYSMETANAMSKAICSFTNSSYGVGITGKLNKQDDSNPYGSNNIRCRILAPQDNSMYCPADTPMPQHPGTVVPMSRNLQK